MVGASITMIVAGVANLMTNVCNLVIEDVIPVVVVDDLVARDVISAVVANGLVVGDTVLAASFNIPSNKPLALVNLMTGLPI